MHKNQETVLAGYHWHQAELEEVKHDGILYLAMNMTSACNYQCPYCFVGLENLKAARDELVLEDKLRVIREAKECGLRVVSMPGRGEPMADRNFWTVLEETERLGLWVVVYTNGCLLDSAQIKQLKDSPVSLFLKVDSFDPDIYEQMVGKQGVFERLRRNIDVLLEHFHEPKIDGDRIITRLGINSVVTAQTAESIPTIHRWCQNHGIYYTCRSPVKVGEAAITWDMLVQDQAERLRAIGQQYTARNFTSSTELGQCGIYLFGITVDNNGEVLVCPDAHSDFGRIGNVKKSSLRELIRRRNEKFPLNSASGYCFVKTHMNSEEKTERE